jgi:hypothetical protein
MRTAQRQEDSSNKPARRAAKEEDMTQQTVGQPVSTMAGRSWSWKTLPIVRMGVSGCRLLYDLCHLEDWANREGLGNAPEMRKRNLRGE